MLKKGDNIDVIEGELNQDEIQNVIFTHSIMNAQDQSLPKDFDLKEGISKVYFYNDAYHVIDVKRILPETQKTFKEAKGRVINDFQDEVEKNWLKKLDETYKVIVNKDVLTKVKSIIKD